jgi:uncharacterized protein (DUF885 family)
MAETQQTAPFIPRISIVVCALFISLLCFNQREIHAAVQPEEESLEKIFADEWKFRLESDPLFATSVGYNAYNDRLPSVTQADFDERRKFYSVILNRLQKIDRSALDRKNQISYDLFKTQIEDFLSELEFRSYLIPLNADSGFHTEFASLPRSVPLFTVKDYENYIARLRAFPKYVGQNIAFMREGLRTGMTLPAVVLQGFEVTVSSHIVDDPAKSIFYKPFASFPNSVPESERQRLREAGVNAIREGVVTGYRDFLQFMQTDYVPKTRRTLGASELPNGRKYYEYLVRHFTTLNKTPEEIHQIGLQEVKRIRSEMDQIIRSVKFEGDFSAFLKFLRTDPRFYVKTPEQLLKEASYIAKRMDGKLPSLFKTLPRLPYGVEPVPDHLAPKYTSGRYVNPSKGSTEPGYYWVNTYALETRPLYTLEALTLHEAVPGHHLQTALASEMEALPEFRKFMYLSAFGEGWGLYSEWLGLEAGFYKDPYSNFGRLTYEMWRACRLVVDTGIHTMDWTREQAMTYLADNTALPLHEVKTETDRYISWPGQALAYKMGELKIRELRKKAEAALGEHFDVREFHDAVLRNGSVTLPILEREIETFIREQQNKIQR